MQMNRRLLLFVTVFFIVFAGTSCTQKPGRGDIPGSVVNNPNSASGHADSTALPVITFEKDFHDFGKLISGEKVTYSFKFKNNGKTMLIISGVTTSCGCTVSDYPREPIKPGEGGSVDVSFDSEGRHGIQNKTITVMSNTQPPSTQLRIQSTVMEPEDLK